MKLFAALLFAVILSAGITGGITAQTRGFGAGVILGEPTGIDVKGWLNNGNAIDGAIAWSFAPKETSFHLHVDYLWHSYNIFKTREEIALYYGIGFRFKASRHEDGRFGPRIPIGLDYMLKSAPIDFFLEFAPIVDLAPATEMSGNAGIGVRYFFK